MNTYNQEKSNLVNSVFNKVHKKYDLMNDIMSFGVHRLWKKCLIDWMKPHVKDKIVDVASGTGDLAKMISEKNNNENLLFCVEPNKSMLQSGKEKLKSYKNINWKLAPAEKLPFKDNCFDFYTISFGIRNVSNINLCLKEARRVLKPGGRFFCLEFSKVDNEILNLIYKQYSKIIPSVGKLIVGSSKPYEYLIKSIEEFYDQKELSVLMQENDTTVFKRKDLKFVTRKKPTNSELKEIEFAFKICKFVKSNAIVLTNNFSTIGIGAGQPSRLDSCKIATEKAKKFQPKKIKNSIAASDAFFPFADGIKKLISAGVKIIVQPGGSIRDQEVINVANKANIKMVLTGTRHFNH